MLNLQTLSWKKALIGAVVAGVFFGIVADPLLDWWKQRSIKYWPGLSNEHLGPGVREILKTRFVDGRLSYILTISPVSRLLKDERDRYLSTAFFTLQFMDDAGFIVLSDSFFLKQMTAIIDQDGVPTYLQYQGRVLCDAARYQSLKTWSMAWALGK